ncbi:MAG: hypothetical protein IPJ34_28195 [Myxococcales bacterium]|nr:hypothetical protein [Myxococcales bacterium]
MRHPLDVVVELTEKLEEDSTLENVSGVLAIASTTPVIAASAAAAPPEIPAAPSATTTTNACPSASTATRSSVFPSCRGEAVATAAMKGIGERAENAAVRGRVPGGDVAPYPSVTSTSSSCSNVSPIPS